LGKMNYIDGTRYEGIWVDGNLIAMSNDDDD